MAAIKADQEFGNYQSALDRLRSVKPQRWTIDPIRTMDALYHGALIAKAEGAERLVLHEVIEVLFREAAETEKAIPQPGPAGYGQPYPEVFYTSAEIKQTQNAREELVQKGENYNTPSKAQASQSAMLRHDEVTKWLRYAGGSDAKLNRRILWRVAQGAPLGAIAGQEKMQRRAVKWRYTESLDRISDRLKQECPELKTIFP